MKLVLLGTGDALGTPRVGCTCDTWKGASFGTMPSRTRFSILVDNGKRGKVMIDTSPDLRWQLLKAAISRFNAILWTHPHYDHYAGFGELARIQGDIDVYGIHETLDSILPQFHFINFNRHDVNAYEPFELINLKFTFLKVAHPDNSIGILISDLNGKKVVITGDTQKHIPQKSLKLMEGADVLIADAIVPGWFRTIKHMNADEAIELGEQLKIKRVVLTHLSHKYPPFDVSRYPLSYDDMIIEL